jgi:hypothetical protein
VEVVEGSGLVAGGEILEMFILDPHLVNTPAFLLAVAVDGRVDRDPRKPGPDLGAGVDAPLLLEEFDEGILDDLEGIFGVSQIAIGDPIEASLVPRHEAGEGVLIPRFESGDKFLVGDSLRRIHELRSSTTSAEIDKHSFAIVFGDLDQGAEREFLEVAAAEAAEPFAGFAAPSATTAAEVMVVKIPVEIAIPGQATDQAQRNLESHEFPLIGVVNENSKLPSGALSASHRVGGPTRFIEVAIRV